MADWCQELYEAHAPQILLYGRALGLSHGEAEDVLQDAFMVLMQRATPPDEPLHYCLRTYRNKALNYRRGLWRRLTRELESKEWFEPGSGNDRPAERAALHSLRGLPADQREVIVLKIWHEYTFEEIGALLELSPNTVAGRYRYGMNKLRACLTTTDYEQLESFGDDAAILDPAPAVRQA